MSRIIIQKTQSRILSLLPKDSKLGKGELLRDSCSELSRLVAGWFEEDKQFKQYYILKGKHVCETKKSHDILAVIAEDSVIYLIDPTVWQFFPQDKEILIAEVNSLDEAMRVASDKYGGTWKISEELKNISPEEKTEWLRIINLNSHS